MVTGGDTKASDIVVYNTKKGQKVSVTCKVADLQIMVLVFAEVVKRP